VFVGLKSHANANGKDKDNGKDSSNSNSKQQQPRQKKTQIPPLRCGMTTKEAKATAEAKAKGALAVEDEGDVGGEEFQVAFGEEVGVFDFGALEVGVPGIGLHHA
jgi:hypothetical protein